MLSVITGPFVMMDMTQMPTAMMWGMGLFWILAILLLLLGMAALIKYLRS
jgi:hypothetical protein